MDHTHVSVKQVSPAPAQTVRISTSVRATMDVIPRLYATISEDRSFASATMDTLEMERSAPTSTNAQPAPAMETQRAPTQTEVTLVPASQASLVTDRHARTSTSACPHPATTTPRAPTSPEATRACATTATAATESPAWT